MRRQSFAALVAVFALSAPAAAFPDPPPLGLVTAQGSVEKVDKDTLSVQPRGPDGKFQKVVVLKLTGTTKISQAGTRDAAGKVVIVQRDVEARALRPGQTITPVYPSLKEGNVLLSAVAIPMAGK